MELFKTRKKLINNLKKVINSLEYENNQLKEKNRIYEKDLIILLDNAKEFRERITDLENNIELLTNNLSPAKKEKIGL